MTDRILSAVARRLVSNKQVTTANLLLSLTGRHCLLHECEMKIEDLLSISDKFRYLNEQSLGAERHGHSSMQYWNTGPNSV